MRCKIVSVTSADDNLLLRMRSETVVNDSNGKSEDIERSSLNARRMPLHERAGGPELNRQDRSISRHAIGACLTTPCLLASGRASGRRHLNRFERKPGAVYAAPARPA